MEIKLFFGNETLTLSFRNKINYNSKVKQLFSHLFHHFLYLFDKNEMF